MELLEILLVVGDRVIASKANKDCNKTSGSDTVPAFSGAPSHF